MAAGSKNLLGIGYMLVAAASFAAFSVVTKLAVPTIPLMEIVFYRGAVALVLLCLWEKRRYGRLQPSVARKDLLIRSLLGLTGLVAYVHALGHIELGLASALNQSSPLFVALFAFLVLHERTRLVIIPLILVGFAGATMVVSPDLGAINVHALVGLGSAVVSALAYTWVRKLRKTDRPETIVRWFSATVSLFALPIVTVQGWTVPTPYEALLIFGLGFFSLTGQLGLTNAYRHGAAGVVSPFLYFAVLLSLLLGWLLWQEWPTLTALGGAALLVASSIGVALLDSRSPAGGNHES